MSVRGADCVILIVREKGTLKTGYVVHEWGGYEKNANKSEKISERNRFIGYCDDDNNSICLFESPG